MVDELEDDQQDEGPSDEDLRGSEESTSRTCPKCKSAVYEDAIKCPRCGYYLSGEIVQSSKLFRWVAIVILALLVVGIIVMITLSSSHR